MDIDEVNFLTAMLRIPSVSGQEAEVANFLVAQMHGFGWETYVDPSGSAIGHLGDSGPLIVLLGHIDTVPGNIPVRIEGDLLYGRGSVDAKGPFATFVMAARRAQLAGTLRCRIALVGATEEEAASSRGAHYAKDQYAPQFCVIGEPSGWDRITLGYKGRLLAHYYYEQDAAHSAGEERAAPEHMTDFWAAVQSLCAKHNQGHTRLFEQMIPSLRRVASGGDGMSDWVEATIGIRLPEGVNPAALADELEAMAMPATLRCEGGCPAFRSPRTTPLVSAFMRSIRKAGGQPGFLHKTGTADMNVVGPAWGCPIVAYGPGNSQLDHTPNEHISISEYRTAIAILSDVLSQVG
ncbi:[LysW]-lysine hydrolase [Candidatus Oscillochloris fontis]|uniref:[LysW]-lysine hydrolase n=1 Tax=Candidatus Oscillochloris fontis TaxID=2496868 RepID=UPI00101CCC09|nr:[LysW]-lysine hydrolase [Candidatus Oscillochloris fontis]